MIPADWTGPPVAPRAVIRAVCTHFEIKESKLCAPTRKKGGTLMRHLAMYLMRRATHLSLSEIGETFALEHTTVMKAIEKVEVQRGSDARVRAHIEAMEVALGCLGNVPRNEEEMRP